MPLLDQHLHPHHHHHLLLLLLLPIPSLLRAQSDHPSSSANLSTTWTNDPSQLLSTSPHYVRIILLGLSKNDSDARYACRFFCNSPCNNNAFLFAVLAVGVHNLGNKNRPHRAGIPYSRRPCHCTESFLDDAQVVWSANRDHPVGYNATLHFTAGGDLILRDADGGVVWSAGNPGKPVAGMNITESGNLVLHDQNGTPVWQSFEHPTDTLVLGQTLQEGQRLVANTSATNSTQGLVFLTLRSHGLYGFSGSSPPQLYYRTPISDNKTTKSPTYMRYTNGRLEIYVNPGTPDRSMPLPSAPAVQFMRLESDGHLRIYGYSQGWQIDVCDYPTVCGEYGICSNNGQCSCPRGENASSVYFQPVDDRQPSLGCSPVTPLSCQSMEEHNLLAVHNVSYFNYDKDYFNYDKDNATLAGIDEESCKRACLKNCSCKAALFKYHWGNASNGYCLLPSQLFSLQNMQPPMGHNASAYIKVQMPPHNSTSPASQPSNPPPSGNNKDINIGVIFSIVGGIIAAIVIGSIIIVFVRRKKAMEDEEDDFHQVPGMPTWFSFEQLKLATNNFSIKLGEGGFGSVYEGKLGDERVAVKRLDGVGQGKKELLAEVDTIGSIHHINLVRLIGFCVEKSHRLLVYEYMCNGSLDKWIFNKGQHDTLDWQTKCKIITDIAKGLSYLHEDSRQRIAHLDIKPQNILLDDKFNAKVSDFGLAKLIDRDQEQVMTRMRGTPGYLAPEWLTSIITERVDIYSFGIVVMEIIFGRKNLDLSQPEERVHLC